LSSIGRYCSGTV